MTRLIRLAGIFVLSALICFWAGIAFSQSRLPGKWTFPDEIVEALSIQQAAVWAAACEATKMEKSCRDIVPPRVAYGLLAYQYGAFDLGSRTVLIDIRILFQPASTAIIFHEMVHYLQGKRDPRGDDLITHDEACAGEQEAHELTLKFASDMKIDDPVRIRPWAVAKAGYGCP